MIYFLQPVDGGPVKIGQSIDVDARRVQLESHYGTPLALLATMPGGRNEEREIHERFAHLRFKRTEQFRPAADLMAFIGRPLLVDANPDAVEAMPGTHKPDQRPVRLDLSLDDHERLDRCAKRFGLSKTAYVRMVLFQRLEADDVKVGRA